ncbi:segregation and condensation protein A [Candidatus Acidulodesulfobacterium sp. H_13]|uniref:segregation and condensation protein A n=1 Tax=Candidatus Acidulodesulfobacterium sp. H_13 TaxID=3395470 RepID=UPI003AF92D4B
MRPVTFSPNVTLQVYDGPIDLLLSLIKKNKINIYDIPIAEITNQYLEAIGLDENAVASTSNNLDIDSGGNFIVMAAQLIYIKSVMLLPKYDTEKTEGNEDDATADPRTELTDMLLEYRKVREVALFLNNRPILGRDVFEIGLLKNSKTPTEKRPGKSNASFNANIFILSQYFYNKITEAQNRISVYEVTKDNFSIKEKIIEIMEMFKGFKNLTFSGLVKNCVDKDELFTYFIALLEMSRLILANLEQFQLFGEILITPVTGSLETYDSKIANMS